MAESDGVVKLVELETTALGREELKEKDCGAGVSNAENLQKEKTDVFFIYIIHIKTSMFQLEFPNR